MGALNTAGSGCVAPLGLPSGEAMETVGREAIISCWLVDYGSEERAVRRIEWLSSRLVVDFSILILGVGGPD